MSAADKPPVLAPLLTYHLYPSHQAINNEESLMIEPSNIPIPGGMLLAGAVWAAFSALAGPEIADRTIQNADWPQACVQ